MKFENLIKENLYTSQILEQLCKVENGLTGDQNKKILSNTARFALQEFFHIIQGSKCYFIADQKQEMVSSNPVQFTDEIYYYGIQTPINGQMVTIDRIKCVNEIDGDNGEALPLNRLLGIHLLLDPVSRKRFLNTVKRLKAFYQSLDNLRNTIIKHR